MSIFACLRRSIVAAGLPYIPLVLHRTSTKTRMASVKGAVRELYKVLWLYSLKQLSVLSSMMRPISPQREWYFFLYTTTLEQKDTTRLISSPSVRVMLLLQMLVRYLKASPPVDIDQFKGSLKAPVRVELNCSGCHRKPKGTI